MRKYFYEINRPDRNLRMRQYIYWIGPYRYNWHEELEIMLILKGQVELSCGGVGYCLEEDDLIVIDSNVGHASLARSEGSIAMGERAISIQEMEQIMVKKAARYVRPDVCALGGISPCKKAAAMAEDNYVGIVPHNPLGPVSTAACLQLDACIPNFSIQEFPSFYLSGGESAMLKEPLQVENGYIRIPDKPGIGIELAEDIVEKFPPKQRSISAQISYDGSVRDL